MKKMLKNIAARFALRRFDTDQLIEALDLLNRADPVKAKVDAAEVERARRCIVRELLRRPGVEFDVYLK